MQRILTLLVVVALVMTAGVLQAQAAFVAGTPAGTNIAVGGDSGTPNQVDLAGEVVASYTSVVGNDTAYRTNQGMNPAATVLAVFGDTVQPVGLISANLAPGGVQNFTMSITNFANQSDVIKIRTDTSSVTGSAKDSVTIRINGVIIYQFGNDSFTPVSVGPLASGADTLVQVQIAHDTTGALGDVSAVIKTFPNAGAGGDPGGYSGNNGIDSYAGVGNDMISFSVYVKTIKVQMLVDQDPTVSPAGYNGPGGDTVPGSTLTYVIRYDNDGNDTAVAFTINTKIPIGTVLAQADSGICAPHTNALVSVAPTDDTGTVVGLSVATRVRWTFSVGVAPNNGDNANTVDAASADYDAGYVRFKVYIK